MVTIVALLVLSGIAGALVVWSMSWEGAWPGPGGPHPEAAPAHDGQDAASEAAFEPLEGDGESTSAPPRRRRRRARAETHTVTTTEGVQGAVAIMEHGEPYTPPSILARVWAMVRLVLVVAVACGLVAGAIYWVASTISKAVGHGGG